MPERITVNGYDVEGGVVTYNISVGDTLTLTKRFRECVALSDALKKADPSVAALPNPLHHNLRSTEKLAKTRVESLQEFLAALPLASLASDDWATFMRLAMLLRTCSAMSGMSSTRARSGGTWIGSTFNR